MGLSLVLTRRLAPSIDWINLSGIFRIAAGLLSRVTLEQDGSMTEATPETRSVVVERTLPHRPEKIWRALSQSDLIEQWLMKNDFEPVRGPPFQF